MINHAAAITTRTTNAFTRATSRIRTPLMAIASAVCLTAPILPAPAMAQTGVMCSATGNEGGGSNDLHYYIGQTVQISGDGFAPNCDLKAAIDRPDGMVDVTTVTTDADGKFSLSYPASTPAGDYFAHLIGQNDAELMGMYFTAGPFISLDKGDYPNGETVQVTGLSFTPLADTVIRVTRPDGSIVKSDGTPGSDTVTSDQLGDLAYGYVIRDGVVAQYNVDALDQTGNVLASTFFTDSSAFTGNFGTNLHGAGSVSSLAIANNCSVAPCSTGAPVGSHVIVTWETGGRTGGSGPSSCADSKGNVYSVDFDFQATSTAGGLGICSAYITTALTSSDTVTVNFPSNGNGQQLSANVFSGLDPSGAFDGSKGAAGTSNLPNSGTVAVTGEHVLIGAVVYNNTNFTKFTAGAGYTLTHAPNPQPGPLGSEYRIVTVDGNYAATGTLSASQAWRAAIAAYKVAAAPLTGHVIVTKVTDPANDPTSFSITASGSGTISGAATRNISATTGTVDYEVTAGTYSVSEAAVSGWVATGNTCANLSVAAGETKTCTITNTKKGHIVVTKVTDPAGDSTTFSITASGSGTISGAATRNISTAATVDYEVTTGTYSVSEAAQPGWVETSNNCSNLVVAAGATVNCTITNTKSGHVIVTKVTDPAGDSTTFSITASGSSTISGSPTRNISATTGTVDYEVAPGTYAVSEAAQPGWVETSNNCSGLVVAAGATVNCTITNTKKGHVVVTKVTDPAGNTTQFSIVAQTSNGTITGTANRTITTAASVDYEVTPGNYRVGELAQAGWTQTGTTCQGLVVAAGQTVNCTITNTKNGVIVVTKNTVPSNDNSTQFSVSLNAAPASGTQLRTLTGNGGTTSYDVIPAGGYSVTETAQAGWVETSNTCTGLSVSAGGSVSCTITNTKNGHLLVTKQTVPTGNTTAFSVTASGSGTIFSTNPQGLSTTTGADFEVTPGTYSATEAPQTGWVQTGSTCANVNVAAGESVACVITNSKDTDGDGIPDNVDCSPTVYDDLVVDSANGVTSPFLSASRRFTTLQAAVNAATDNNVISMYINTTENVVIGGASGGKDLRILGCSHKITSAAPQAANLPVITVQSTAGATGANDASNAAGAAMDIQIEDLDVLKGSTGVLIQTTKPVAGGTSTLLKSIRSDQNGPSNGTGAATAANPGHGIRIEGDGNEVRGANSIGTNSGDGISVVGSGNTLESNRIQSNKGDGIDVTGMSNTIEANKVGEKSLGNKGNGIVVTCPTIPAIAANCANTLNENDVFGNTLLGIKVTGNMNLVYKNDVGEDGKGNLGGGILITGDNNVLGKAASENNVFENTGVGIAIVGNNNTVSKNDVGDKDKGNTGDGINVKGYGNVIDQNNVFANGGDGVEVSGGTAAKPNVISNNNVGDKGKSNLGNGIVVGSAADVGNGAADPIEINANTVRANKLNGIYVQTAGHQIANNVSGGTGSYASGGQDNGKCEFLVTVAGNFNAGGNTANGAAVTVAAAWPAGTATTCQGTP